MNNITLSTKFRPIKPLPPLFEGLDELGRVTAGIPLEAIEDRQRSELLSLLTAPGRYALQVSDDSMCEAGIIQGDIVVVQSQQQARYATHRYPPISCMPCHASLRISKYFWSMKRFSTSPVASNCGDLRAKSRTGSSAPSTRTRGSCVRSVSAATKLPPNLPPSNRNRTD